jgi:hypothetical protein
MRSNHRRNSCGLATDSRQHDFDLYAEITANLHEVTIPRMSRILFLQLAQSVPDHLEPDLK